jgi:hypothetical protein
MNRWDAVLLVVVGYVAAMALVRLMIQRRSQVLDEFRRRVKIGKKKDRNVRQPRPPEQRDKAA